MTSSLQKKNRLRSKENLDYIKSLPCFVCGASAPSDPDHIRTKAAFGGDALNNLQSLCRKCHCERHTIGIKTFITKYYERLILAREKYELPAMDLTFLGDS